MGSSGISFVSVQALLVATVPGEYGSVSLALDILHDSRRRECRLLQLHKKRCCAKEDNHEIISVEFELWAVVMLISVPCRRQRTSSSGSSHGLQGFVVLLRRRIVIVRNFPMYWGRR